MTVVVVELLKVNKLATVNLAMDDCCYELLMSVVKTHFFRSVCIKQRREMCYLHIMSNQVTRL